MMGISFLITFILRSYALWGLCGLLAVMHVNADTNNTIEANSDIEPIATNAVDNDDFFALFSINTGSFLYHAFPKNEDSNQYFDNRLFSIERKFSADSDYSWLTGTFLNSQKNRCVLLGMRKDWYRINDRFVIKGVYAYAGEFFINTFSHCGDDGFYETMKDHTGVGFAPYLYHAAQYNVTDYWGIEAGLMLPGILVMSMQWSF